MMGCRDGAQTLIDPCAVLDVAAMKLNAKAWLNMKAPGEGETSCRRSILPISPVLLLATQRVSLFAPAVFP